MKKYLIVSILALGLLLPVLGLAQTAPGCHESASSSLCNPLGSNPSRSPRVDTFTDFIIFVLGVFASLGGIASIVFVTVAGFMFLISQGNEEKVSQARRSLQWTISGLVLMLLSYALVISLQVALRFQGPPDNPNTFANPIGINNFTQLYRRVIEGFFEMMGLIAILMLVFNGFRYMTARGNEEQAGAARAGITYAVLGIAIALLAYVIVHSVGVYFGRN